MRYLITGLAALVFSVAGSVSADSHPPVALHFDAPNSNGGVVLLSESGWPLNIKMVIDYEDILGYAIHTNFTGKGGAGFLVLDDPDGCPWMDDDDWRIGGPAPIGCEAFIVDSEVVAPEDETYIEFRPDVDEAGMPDSSGDADEQAELVDSAGGGGPKFQRFMSAGECMPSGGDTDCIKMGPDTGGEVVDGYGIGSDDDIVGLFLYMTVGIGLVYAEPDFELTDLLGVHNLAGLVNSVTYDLSDLTKSKSKAKGTKGKPTETIKEEARIWAHVNMPKQVVRNIIQYDACVGPLIYEGTPPDESFAGCLNDDGAWRIDGGPIETSPEYFDRPRKASIYLLNNSEFTVYAFLVSGHAPDALFDANGDGDFRDDAELAGYTVLSNLDSISLLQVSDKICFGGGGNAMYMDLDDNGEAFAPIACGPGPGGIDRPPR